MKNNDASSTRSHLGYIDVYPQRELWQKVSDDFNGSLRIKHDASNAIEILELSIPYKSLIIKLSLSDTRPLKFEISFNSSRDFGLVVSREDSLDKLLKKFGKREIEIGFGEFDNQYFIQSNNSSLALSLLTNTVAQEMLNHNIASLSISINQKSCKGEYICCAGRVVSNKEDLADLIKLHQLIVDRLEELCLLN